MDVAYNQHASSARRKNRSTTNLNHLTLAPLTSRLPLADDDDDFVPDPLSAPVHTTSYLQGKSAPTTPGLLSRSPARSRSHTRRSSGPAAALPKSKSTTQLGATTDNHNHQYDLHHRHARQGSGVASPGGNGGRRRKQHDDAVVSARDRSDSDWLLRAGALISTEARESKGQAWLASRASSTSLTGVRDAEEEALERELARERELTSRHASRRGSLAGDEDVVVASPSGSRFGSRSQSRAGSRIQMLTPAERRSGDGYFHPQGADESQLPGPDFVNLDEKLEAIEQDTSEEDEAHVRRLVKRGNAGVGTWFGNVLGWTLFSVEENEEETDGEDDTTEGDMDDDAAERPASRTRHFEGVAALTEERIPAPKADEGGWQDAAWLLSVASKVLL